MPKRNFRPTRGPRTYGWVRAIPRTDSLARGLSQQARYGIGYARQLADNAHERSRAALHNELLPEPLTVAQLAREDGVATVTVYTALKRARIELFGKDLSDSAIYDR